MSQSIASWGNSSATRVTLAAKNEPKSKFSDGTVSSGQLVMLREHKVDNDTTSTDNNRQNSHNFMQQSCNVTEATKNNIRWMWKVRSGAAKVRRRLLCRKFIRRNTHVNLIRIGQHAGVRYRSSCKGRGRAHFQSNTPGARYRRKQHFKLIQDLQRGLLAYELTARSFWADNCLDVLRQIRQEQFGRRQWSKVLQELLYTTRSTKLPMQSRIRHLQHMRKSKPTFYVDLSEFYQTLPPARLQRSIKVRLQRTIKTMSSLARLSPDIPCASQIFILPILSNMGSAFRESPAIGELAIQHLSCAADAEALSGTAHMHRTENIPATRRRYEPSAQGRTGCVRAIDPLITDRKYHFLWCEAFQLEKFLDHGAPIGHGSTKTKNKLICKRTCNFTASSNLPPLSLLRGDDICYLRPTEKAVGSFHAFDSAAGPIRILYSFISRDNKFSHRAWDYADIVRRMHKDLNKLENQLYQSSPTLDTYLGIRIDDPLDPPKDTHTEYLSSDQGENSVRTDDILTNSGNTLTDSDMNNILFSSDHSGRYVVGEKTESNTVSYLIKKILHTLRLIVSQGRYNLQTEKAK